MPEMQQQQREDRDPHQPSSLPPWVHINTSPSSSDRIPTPQNQNAAHLASRAKHNDHPPPLTHFKPGRKWDHLRDAEPALLSTDIQTHQQRWREFMVSGPNPQEPFVPGTRVVDQAWMDVNMPHLNSQWDEERDGWHPLGEAGGEAALQKGFSGLMYRGKWLISPERQERTVMFFWRLLLKNPFVPLAFRLTVLTFSAAALGIAGTIMEVVFKVNHDNDPNNQCAMRASTYMAVCVGSIAIPYLGYVTWDEYMSKPLGLRSVPTKVLLLLCDLYFVVFAASNLSLAFDTLFDHRWACYDEQYAIIANGIDYSVPSTCPNNPSICKKQITLAAILLISLLAWLITFSLSVMRVVEKLRPD
ncbi:hypothetical protein LTR62_004370 [Meristemomyces frigidus]|uniref:Uncharacterized protein n=1 Tax=Meristemomyces frigidus TaxID=1508187 RepID=A0AAN7TES9_9PEZI|nr:hypothetical protein LTR62_004370 [Meristemomyces frigidus]